MNDKEIRLLSSRQKLEAALADFPRNGMPLVWGEGNPDAAILLIGEAPGEQESLMGRPFVGKAGKNLDGFVERLGIRREDLYITNVVKFRPCIRNEKTGRYRNRPPKPNEIAACVGHLFEEIDIIRPRWIVTLGNTALHAVSPDPGITIGDVHGTALDLANGTRLFPLYHPASIIYNRSLEAVYRDDLDRFNLLK